MNFELCQKSLLKHRFTSNDFYPKAQSKMQWMPSLNPSRLLMMRYDNWNNLLFHMLDGQRAFRPRSAARCTRLVGLIYEQCEGDWTYAKYII